MEKTYKAKPEFKDLKEKFFGVHKIIALENGGEVIVSNPKLIPKDVLECLEEKGAENTSKKTTKKKGS